MSTFLERDAALAELETALVGAASGRGRVALISGEAGIGKTTLLEQFARRRAGQARVLWGACDALFTPRPLGPLHDVAAQLPPGALPSLAAETHRAELHAALLAVLQGAHTLLVIEDLHWADEATLDLVRFLGRRMPRTRALLALTYRDDELSLAHPLRTVLGDLATSGSVTRVTLAPLTPRAVKTLVGERGLDAAALHRQTGGNPFFVTEVLAAEGTGLPATIRDAVLARAARLSPAGRAALEAAAVVGPRIEHGLLERVAGPHAPAVEEGLALGILTANGPALAFRHELARQTILETLSPTRARALHRAALAALQSAPGEPDPARLAHHAEVAGDHQAVSTHAPAAARQAAAARAHREAAALYALALRHAAGQPPALRAELLEALAVESNLIDQRAEALAARREALALWQAAGQPLRAGACLAHMAFLLNGLGQTTEAERVCAQALSVLEAHPPGLELAFAYRVQSGLHMLLHNHRAGIAWGERCIALAEQFGDHNLVLSARNTIGTCWLTLDYAFGCGYLERNLADAQAAGLDAIAAHAYANLSSTSSEFHQFDRAEHYAAEGEAYAAERGLEHFRLYITAWQAITHLRLGRWPQAEAAAQVVLRRPGVSITSRITALAALGHLYARRGSPDAAALLDEALALSTHTTSLHRLGLVRAARAEAAWLLGDAPRALAEARAVFPAAQAEQHPWFGGELAYWQHRAGAPVPPADWMAPPYARHLAGDWRGAAEAWAALNCPYEQARALAEGDPAAQIAALEIWERLGAEPAADALRARLRRARVPSLPRRPRAATRANPLGLTARQAEVLALLAEGLSNAAIAARLHISAKTADHHVSAVLARLNVHTREEAAALARSASAPLNPP